MAFEPVNSPINCNLVWARNPHGAGYIKLICHPQTIDKVMELGAESKFGEYVGLVHGNPPVPPDGFTHVQTDGLKRPVAIFKGLKRPLYHLDGSADGDVYIYVTNPTATYSYRPSVHGNTILECPRPVDSVFTTFVSVSPDHVDEAFRSMGKPRLQDVQGVVFFWEWTESARNSPLLPFEHNTRYLTRIN